MMRTRVIWHDRSKMEEEVLVLVEEVKEKREEETAFGPFESDLEAGVRVNVSQWGPSPQRGPLLGHKCTAAMECGQLVAE